MKYMAVYFEAGAREIERSSLLVSCHTVRDTGSDE